MKRPQLAMIKWLDHASFAQNGWHSLAELADLTPSEVISVGWIAAEDDHIVLMYSTSAPDCIAVSGEICIIKKTILKRWKLPDPSLG